MNPHTFLCVDAHTCGNPVRVVAGGAPLLPNVSMAERRQIFLRDHDWVRKALMFEPRGHDVMSGSILYPPSREDCELGVLFIEVSGCLPMCGHGTIGTVTVALEQGFVVPKVEGKLALEVPAGKVDIEYTRNGRFVDQVRLFNIASYLHAEAVAVEVPGIGELVVDVSYGGNYYAIVEPQKNWAGLDGMKAEDILKWSPAVRAAVQQAVAPVHPQDPRINGVSHVMWADRPKHAEAHGRNAVFFGDKGIDRSPCGTGTSARMAQRAAKGLLKVGDDFVHESIIGTLFHGRVESTAEVAGRPAIRPSVGGWAHVYGHNTITVDERDPLAFGFQLA
ncbi:4-hydroxyproline epimerase [Ancylobacter dichloromethanicus]|uniref:Hydroxyproline-2-epimerase n=1 Tax=Ancylobacter dichloromethanicus TaxID=518825 RepID=A0A9W6JA94_9HYPH|nr:4-hydroxyproline epimerase [Ancylobacter dichloromethanicus]MBS7552790.1 4-hydroxyproline epimerase [Ancylobacter dichloromethanicus]GLK72154.1 hydroxyproline-2-epimerase [Ancylobacter dichloromethanicus]